MRTRWMVWLILGFNSLGNSQNLKPKIAPFKGNVYSIPDEKKVIGFGSYLDSLIPIQTVKYKHLNIPDRDTEYAFPQIEERYGFGMILNSTMKIDTLGYYDFHLSSDDGSRLWIDGKLIINNDGDHKMTLKSDTVILDKGIHKIKIWYYQAYALRYGLIFEYDFYDFTNGAHPFKAQDTYNVLFNINKASLDQNEGVKLKSYLDKINCLEFKSASIFGHTDNSGSTHYNEKLSISRATTVAEFIRNKCPKLIVNVSGFGESVPVLPNNTQLNKSKNRRVSIIFE